jgi:multidrug efflux system membrane fusion protein
MKPTSNDEHAAPQPGRETAGGGPPPAPPTWRTTVVGIAVIAVVSLGAVWWINHRSVTPAAGPGGGGGGFGGGGRWGGGRGGATPVSTFAAEKGELKVYLSALGSVSALNTTTVKANATGELIAIHFSEGQLVTAGDLLVEIDPRQYRISLEQAQGQLARDLALLENVRRDLERYENAKEAVTQQQIDTAQATVAQYEGTVRADQASVDNFKLQLSYCSVTAPITGRAGLRMVDQGNMVRTSDPGIVVITQEQPISVIFSIPEDSLPQVRKAIADGRELGVEVYDRGMKIRLASGKLFAVDNQIDSTTGTVRLKALFANEDQGLFPNQFVNVRMLTEVQENVTLLPNSAIQLNGPARFVFVVKTDETVERRTITVGRTEGEKTVVVDGLAVSEIVVTEGLDRLQSGSKVISRTPVAEAPPPSGRGGRGGKGGRGGRGPGADGKGMPGQKGP